MMVRGLNKLVMGLVGILIIVGAVVIAVVAETILFGWLLSGR